MDEMAAPVATRRMRKTTEPTTTSRKTMSGAIFIRHRAAKIPSEIESKKGLAKKSPHEKCHHVN